MVISMGYSQVLYDNSIYKESIYLYLKYWEPIYEKRAIAHNIDTFDSQPNQLLSKGNYYLIRCLTTKILYPRLNKASRTNTNQLLI